MSTAGTLLAALQLVAAHNKEARLQPVMLQSASSPRTRTLLAGSSKSGTSRTVYSIGCTADTVNVPVSRAEVPPVVRPFRPGLLACGTWTTALAWQGKQLPRRCFAERPCAAPAARWLAGARLIMGLECGLKVSTGSRCLQVHAAVTALRRAVSAC